MAAAQRWTPPPGSHDEWAPTCAIHPDVRADRVCELCAGFACGDCALVRTIRDRQYEACPSCRGVLSTFDARTSVVSALPLPELPPPTRSAAPHAGPLAPPSFAPSQTPPSFGPSQAPLLGASHASTHATPAPTGPAASPWIPREESGVSRIEGDSVAAEVERSATLFALLPSALAYPLSGAGVFVIVGGTIFTWFMAFLARAPLFGFFAAVFGAGYLAAYTLKVVESSAHGEKALPSFPDFTDFWDDILRPLARVISAGLVSFAIPCGAAAVSVVHGGASPFVLVLAIGGGLLYFPMALVAVSVRRTFFAASPHIVLRMIVAAPLEYAVACGIVAALVGIRVVVHLTLAVMFPFIGFLVGDLVAFYLLLVELRVLGLIYHVGRARLDWLEAA